MTRKRFFKKARDKYRNYLKKKKIKRENMEKIDITICLKEIKKN